MIMVSACLFGVDCKYNGQNNYSSELRSALQDKQVMLFCPEQEGGLDTPRPPCEIQGGDGHAVLQGKAAVLGKTGEDLTPAFIKGAHNTVSIAQSQGANLIILKSRSPSCGVGIIYDGTFSSQIKNGDGVTTALLKEQGFQVVSDEEFLSQGRLKK